MADKNEQQLPVQHSYTDMLELVNMADPAAMAAYFPPTEGEEAWDDTSFLDLANEGPLQGTVDSLFKVPQPVSSASSSSTSTSLLLPQTDFKYIPSQHAISAYTAAASKGSQAASRQNSRAASPEGYHSWEYHKQTLQANLAVTLSNAFSSMPPHMDARDQMALGGDFSHRMNGGGVMSAATTAELMAFESDREPAQILASLLSQHSFPPRNMGGMGAAHLAQVDPSSFGADDSDFFLRLPEVPISSFPTSGSGKKRSTDGPGAVKDEKRKRSRGKSPDRTIVGGGVGAAGKDIFNMGANSSSAGGSSSGAAHHGFHTYGHDLVSSFSGGGSNGMAAHSNTMMGAGRSLSMGGGSVCALYLESLDEMQCRFSVKNDDKESNQKLGFVQSNGYVEYKARYCRKRGQKSGYGFFHLGFLPTSRIIYPLLKLDDTAKSAQHQHQHQHSHNSNPMLHVDEINPSEVNRMEITVRMYQSFRGDFPTRLIKFDDDETYHALYVKEWQDATVLKVSEQDSGITYLTVEEDPDGEYLKYIVQDPAAFEAFRTEEGLRFPCPIPAHPERLNDVGMLRLQISLKIFTKHSIPRGSHGSSSFLEYNTWIRFKVVQQLSGKKRKFADMLRPESVEWDLPPRPEILPITMSHDMVIDHVLGSSVFTSEQGYKLVHSFAARVSEAESKDSAGAPSSEPSILHMACRKGNAAVILLLLQHNVSLIHVTDEDGNTPLHYAAETGMANVIQVLLEAGANPAIKNHSGLTCVDVAAQNGFQGVARLLAHQIQMDCTSTGTSLFRAVCIGSVSALKKILKSSMDMRAMDLRGLTPLQIAVLYNHPMCVQSLIHAGADPAVTDEDGNTFLHIAAASGYVEITTILLHHRKELASIKAKDGCTPIFRAASGGHSLCTMILAESGCDVNLTNAKGQTPLDIAISEKFPCTSLVLMKYGGKPAAGSVNPQTLFDYPRTGGTLHDAARCGDVALARHLVASGVSLLSEDEHGMTPVVLAIRNGHALLLDELLVWASHLDASIRGNVNNPGADGNTPLHIACERVDIGCVVILLSNKIANVDCLNSLGDTPLHVAAEKGLTLTAAFLRLAGAKTSIKNHAGETAAEKATKLGHLATLQVLQASKEDLVPISKVLELKPDFDDGSDSLVDPDQFFNWSHVGKILNTIWHCMHSLRRVMGQNRSVPLSMHSLG